MRYLIILGLFFIAVLTCMFTCLDSQQEDYTTEDTTKTISQRPIYNMYEHRPHISTVHLTTGDLHYV